MKTPNWFLKKNIIAYALWPLSILYYLISKTVYRSRSEIRDPRSEIGPVVICIGNIFAGGVGKTPIVRLIAGYFHIPVVMRGYKGRKVSGRVEKASSAADVGDEAKVMFNMGLDVYVGDRAKNIQSLVNAKTVVIDDGFQNPTIKKDISLLVFDSGLRMGNGFMLPAGPLREPLSAIERADGIVIMRRKNTMKRGGAEFIAQLEKYGKPIFFAKTRSIDPGADGNVVAFAGIGYPKKFFDSIAPLYGDRLVKTVSFADHYQYTDADIKKLFQIAYDKKATLITTDKDWVRLPDWAQKKIRFSKQEVIIGDGFWIWIRNKLSDARKEKKCQKNPSK